MTDKNQNVKAEMGAEASSSKQELRDTDMEKVAGGTQEKIIHYRTYNDKGEHDGGGGYTVDAPTKEPDKAPGTDAGASSGTQTNTNHSKGVQMINNGGANNAGGIKM